MIKGAGSVLRPSVLVSVVQWTILIFNNEAYYLQSVLSSRLKLVNSNLIQWLMVSLGVMVHVQVTSLTYEAKIERYVGF